MVYIQQPTDMFDKNHSVYMPNGLRHDYATFIRDDFPTGDDPNDPVHIFVDGVFDLAHLGHH
jgi:hypothetical protein